MAFRTVRLSLLAAIALAPALAAADPLPVRPFDCARTKITRLEHRLGEGPNGPWVTGSGSAVHFANGLYQVSYDELDGIHNARIGDPVFVCLIGIPRNCPPNDNRGRVYTTTDLRTEDSWTLPDSEHRCGGA